MVEIANILDSQPIIQKPMLSSQGVCVWIVWGQSNQPKNATDILLDAGALNIVTLMNQSLWFFFNADVAVNSLAKLDLWGKQFSVGITAFTFPGQLKIDANQIKVIEVANEYRRLKIEQANTRSYIYIHPSYGSMAASIPGISVYEMKGLDVQSSFSWKMITAERRLPFSVEQGWYAFVHPLGNAIDKQFQRGWSRTFRYLEEFIREHKLKYSLQDNYLIVPLDNLMILREWMRAVFQIIETMREQHSDEFWPCLTLVVDKNNLNFTPELPYKINVDWSELAPDVPYISYKNAFILGNDFIIKDIVYSSSKTSFDSFCTLIVKNPNVDANPFSVLLPETLVPNKTPCFYCGASNHPSSRCPSKDIAPTNAHYFEKLKHLDLSDINNVFRDIDTAINQKGVKAYFEFIEENNTAGQVLKAIFAINHVIQLPNICRIWRITSRDIDAEPAFSHDHASDPMHVLLQRFIKCSPQDMHAFERECLQMVHNDPKNWQLQCLLGYIVMEKGDLDKAIAFWMEADKICTITLHQAWLKFLIARAREIQGRYNEAMDMYNHIMRLTPNWQDPQYRILVCDMKRGFTERVSRQLVEMINKDPSLFHKVVLDPELFRGQMHLLMSLQRMWKEAYNRFLIERAALEDLQLIINDWFKGENNPIAEQTHKVHSLLKHGEIKNYLLFLDVVQQRPQLEAEIMEAITGEITRMKTSYERCLFKLEFIRDEMSWFALQKTLTNFNQTFNSCAKILNWAFGSDFTNPKIFKEAQTNLESLETQVQELEKKLKALQMVRDITLFFLLTMRTFFKLAFLFLPIGIVGIFVSVFFGAELGLGQMHSIIKTNFWELFRVTVGVALMLSLGIASLKTTVIFERKRKELIEKAKESRQKKQKERVEKVRKFRASIEEAAQKKNEEEED